MIFDHKLCQEVLKVTMLSLRFRIFDHEATKNGLLGGARGQARLQFELFLVRSCQNDLMRSNNFDVKVSGSKCTLVKAWANNCENKTSE